MKEVMIDRQYDRIMAPLSVVLDCSSGKREVRVSDLSIGGCYVDSIAGVKAEEVVGIRLVLPRGRSEQVFGTVIYVHDGIGFGVQFNDMTREQRTVLEQLVLLNGGKI
ncbi:MAG: PilZ domain-containing protein [Acidobacteria bacterium]|nr:PilZ domain-containing protein [Acidobacteriota bacterium]